jgi:hypothetical protein
VVVAHTNFMGGGHTLFMFFPFLFIGGGLAFICLAAGDKRQTKDRSVRVLPVGAQHPLSHVRHKMKPAKPGPAQRSDAPAQVRPLKRY